MSFSGITFNVAAILKVRALETAIATQILTANLPWSAWDAFVALSCRLCFKTLFLSEHLHEASCEAQGEFPMSFTQRWMVSQEVTTVTTDFPWMSDRSL